MPPHPGIFSADAFAYGKGFRSLEARAWGHTPQSGYFLDIRCLYSEKALIFF